MQKYYEDFEKVKKRSQEKKHKIREVNIRGENTIGIPMWMINNYIKSTCDNYTKLVYFINIIDILASEDFDIVDIGISTESVPVDQDGRDFDSKLSGFLMCPKAGKGKMKYCLMSYVPEVGEKDFAHYFIYCERPVCFAITRDNDVILLHNPRGDEGIKVCDISYHSPIDIGLSGIGSLIEHLTNAGTQARNDSRLQDEHEARMVREAIQTMGDAIDVETKLQNANLPEGHKVYLQNMYNALMAKQEKLNEKIGVCSSGVDVRV